MYKTGPFKIGASYISHVPREGTVLIREGNGHWAYLVVGDRGVGYENYSTIPERAERLVYLLNLTNNIPTATLKEWSDKFLGE